MSLLVTLTNVVESLNPFTGTVETRPTGAEAVKQAIHEVASLEDMEFTATLGEPRIEESGAQFVANPKVAIPIYGTPYGDAGTLIFDLPDRNDNDQLFELLDSFDLSLSQLEDLEGNEVPVEYYGGNPTVAWTRLYDDDENEQQADTDDERGDDDGQDGNDEERTLTDSDSDEGGVNVEEQTVTPSPSSKQTADNGGD